MFWPRKLSKFLFRLGFFLGIRLFLYFQSNFADLEKTKVFVAKMGKNSIIWWNNISVRHTPIPHSDWSEELAKSETHAAPVVSHAVGLPAAQEAANSRSFQQLPIQKLFDLQTPLTSLLLRTNQKPEDVFILGYKMATLRSYQAFRVDLLGLGYMNLELELRSERKMSFVEINLGNLGVLRSADKRCVLLPH
jgi:hypothetical protein